MSDPQQSDVEDVLSSIRRLVSEDKRPVAEVPAEPVPDRLVLTPALRVAEAVPPVEEAEEPVIEPLDATEAFVPNEYWMAPPPEPEAELDDYVAEDEATGDAVDEHDTPDGDVAEDDATDDPVEEAVEAALEQSVPDEDESDAVSDATDEPEAQGLASDNLSEKIAALEAVIARRDEQFEPDDVGADAYAGTDAGQMEWEDVPPEADEVSDRPTGPEIFSSDEDVLDEDALRDLVADIVREELQGALGERITRNVRKLVRREIHRALAAQDLD
ncbi:MAG: hypothetical protein AAGF60_04905 [Pseudomonadota bacterium]